MYAEIRAKKAGVNSISIVNEVNVNAVSEKKCTLVTQYGQGGH